ncbi:MAG: ABC transporter permease [Actinomycetota bacterium]
MSTETVVRAPLPVEVGRPRTVAGRLGGWIRNPWGQPRFLSIWTWLFIIWSLVPVVIAVVFSFNAGRSRSAWQGFSLRWWYSDPDLSIWNDPSMRSAMFQSLKLAAANMLIATPLGVTLAIGLARWRGRLSRPANFLMLLPLVTPEIIMGVSLFLVFVYMIPFIDLGTGAQILGHVTFTISFVVIVVRGRLFAIGREYEEAAMDLGASRAQALRYVLLPLLRPAIFVSAMVALALSLDDFVISQFLLSDAGTVTIPVRVYSAARLGPTPATNALASALLFSTLIIITIAGLVLRRTRRREQRAGSAAEELARLEV